VEIEKRREFAWVKLFDPFADVVGKNKIKERLLLAVEVCADQDASVRGAVIASDRLKGVCNVSKDIEEIAVLRVDQALSDLHPDAMTPSPQPCPKEHSALSSTHSRGMIVERRTISSSKDQAELFQAVLEVGGRAGWYLDWAWRLRGAADRLLGGVGLRRSGRHELEVGGELDFWRVEALSPGRRRLLLKAEMRVPGDAWLEFAIAPGHEKGSVLQQTTYFAPRGLAGILYWYGLLPIHRLIFKGMARRLACANERWSSKSTTT